MATFAAIKLLSPLDVEVTAWYGIVAFNRFLYVRLRCSLLNKEESWRMYPLLSSKEYL